MSGDEAQSRSEGGRRVTNDSDDELIGIVAGVVVAVLALLAAVIVFCVVCRRRIRKYPDDKAAGTASTAAARLPISFAGRTDVVLTSAAANGSVPMYGSHSSPAAAMLLPPAGHDLYDDEDPVKMASGSRESSYRRPNGVFQRRQLPELPRIPVDSAGMSFITRADSVCLLVCFPHDISNIDVTRITKLYTEVFHDES